MNTYLNQRGGITYAASQLVGRAEQRSPALADVRMIADALNDLCTEVRRDWPARYPMPPELDALMTFQDYAMRRLRSGMLKKIADNDR